jgi:hypothetical protein
MLSGASCGVSQVRSTSDLRSRSAWPSDVLGQAAAVVDGYQAEVPPVQDQERRLEGQGGPPLGLQQGPRSNWTTLGPTLRRVANQRRVLNG